MRRQGGGGGAVARGFTAPVPRLSALVRAHAPKDGRIANTPVVCTLRSPRFFRRCRVSALAALRMLLHSMEGVRKGTAARNGMPVEVMGLLFGASRRRRWAVRARGAGG